MFLKLGQASTVGFGSSNECIKPGIDSYNVNELIKLNNELMNIGTAIQIKMDNMKEQVSTSKELKEMRLSIDNQSNELKSQQSEMIENNQHLNTINGREQNSNLLVNSTYYKYLMWLLLALLIAGLVVKYVILDNNETLFSFGRSNNYSNTNG